MSLEGQPPPPMHKGYVSESQFTRVGSKPKGGQGGYIGTDTKGRQYMLKDATGYAPMAKKGEAQKGGRASASWGPDSEIALEYIANGIFKKVIGTKSSPQLQLVQKTSPPKVGAEKRQLYLASKWIKNTQDLKDYKAKASEQKDPANFPGISKILTLAKILRVEDFKDDHIVLKESKDEQKQVTRTIIVDCAANFKDCANFVKSNVDLFDPSYSNVTLSSLNEDEVIETATKFCELTLEDIDTLLEDVKGIFAEEKINDIRENLIKTQEQVRAFLADHT